MRGSAGRFAKVFALALLALAVTTTGSSAATPAHAPILGIVPHVTGDPFLPRLLPKAIGHVGPPALTFDSNYESLINQYLTDVAVDSGGTNNVYSVANQYYDNPGSVHIQYQSIFAGSYVTKDPLPANGCNDGFDTYCLTDQQLQDEIQAVMTAKGWQGGLSHMFFLMTPNGIGSCEDASGSACSTNVFCAYHSAFGPSINQAIIYANEPYLGPSGGCVDPSQGFPSGDVDSDTTINTISHEHNEAITDPLGSGWIANDGYENGDLCAYVFGTAIAGTPGTDAYNQVINGHHYDLQQEYSNADHGCIQRPGGTVSSPNVNEQLPYNGGPVMHTNTTYAIYWLPTPGNTSVPVVTGTQAVNATLSTSPGSWTGAPTGFIYQWQRCSSAGTSCVNIPGATANTYRLTATDSNHTMRSTVRANNLNGQSPPAASAVTTIVVPAPSASSAPVVSGVAAVHQQLSTTDGTWNTAANFTYAWLRCSASATGCTVIPGATATSYTLTAADAGHTLKARVLATNAAGTTSADSNASGLVVDVPAASAAPHVSGRAKVGKKLTASHGSWSGTPTTYRFQWLRCNAHGGSCTAIGKATRPAYKLTKRDAKHRLRIRVTAVNAAGNGIAISSPTATVKR